MIFVLLAIAFGGFVLYVAIAVWIAAGRKPSDRELARFEGLDYFKNGRFFGDTEAVFEREKVQGGGKNFAQFLYLFLVGDAKHRPYGEIPQINLDRSSFNNPSKSFAIYWLGHAAAIAEIEEKRILIDPVFGSAAPISFLIPRYCKAPISINELPPIDFCLITHDHYDHLEWKTINQLRYRTKFIVPLAVKYHLIKWGVPEDRIIELGWGEKFSCGKLAIAAEKAQHYGQRAIGSRNKTLWCSYAVLGEKEKIYFGGDSGYGSHYKEIGVKYGGFDLAVLEIDAWNAGWAKSHLFPNEVLTACKDLNAKAFLPAHWGVFDLARHHWKESIEAVEKEFAAQDKIAMLTPLMGERVDLSKTEYKKWWKEVE